MSEEISNDQAENSEGVNDQVESNQPETADWVIVAQADELADGKSKSVSAGGNNIALFRSGQEYFAVADACAHYGAPLCGGYVRNGAVSCPWHGWQFDLQTGECLTAPGCNIEAYQVKIEDGAVKIAVG